MKNPPKLRKLNEFFYKIMKNSLNSGRTRLCRCREKNVQLEARFARVSLRFTLTESHTHPSISPTVTTLSQIEMTMEISLPLKIPTPPSVPLSLSLPLPLSPEALQQEVISHDIHVSLVFPPDTDTPGFAEETKRRPPLTGIIAESSGAMKAEDVAKRALDGIKSASFIVPCNFEGLLLSIATAGLSPQRSFVMAFFEVVAAGLVRLVALCFQWNWYTSIQKWQAQNKRT